VSAGVGGCLLQAAQRYSARLRLRTARSCLVVLCPQLCLRCAVPSKFGSQLQYFAQQCKARLLLWFHAATWRRSREKVRPKDELQRAEQVIARSKEIIRQVSIQVQPSCSMLHSPAPDGAGMHG
jgi:hypothetical protein